MCSSKARVTVGIESATMPPVGRINGRPVFQPTCNRVPTPERRNSIKKPTTTSPPLPRMTDSLTTPVSPKAKSPRLPAIKRGHDSNGLNSSCEKIVIPRNPIARTPTLARKKSNSFKEGSLSTTSVEASLSYSSSLITDAPGSIAAVRREQMALQQAQRKMKIAHYGRSNSAKFLRVFPLDPSTNLETKTTEVEKRCSFITTNSGNRN